MLTLISAAGAVEGGSASADAPPGASPTPGAPTALSAAFLGFDACSCTGSDAWASAPRRLLGGGAAVGRSHGGRRCGTCTRSVSKSSMNCSLRRRYLRAAGDEKARWVGAPRAREARRGARGRRVPARTWRRRVGGTRPEWK